MSRFLYRQFIILSFLSLSIVYQSKAIGLGAYGGFTVGSISNSYNTNTTGYQAGFVLDTRVAGNKLVNYRLNLGLSSTAYTYNYDQEFFSTYLPQKYTRSLTGLDIDNTIGFGFLRNRIVRLWAGPKVKVIWQFSGTGNSSNNYEIDDAKFGIGLAPVIGANFHLGDVVSLCADMGYNMLSSISTSHIVTGFETGFFMNASVLFRLGHDVYGGNTAKKKVRGYRDDED